jgi:hypothetical protein
MQPTDFGKSDDLGLHSSLASETHQKGIEQH